MIEGPSKSNSLTKVATSKPSFSDSPESSALPIHILRRRTTDETPNFLAHLGRPPPIPAKACATPSLALRGTLIFSSPSSRNMQRMKKRAINPKLYAHCYLWLTKMETRGQGLSDCRIFGALGHAHQRLRPSITPKPISPINAPSDLSFTNAGSNSIFTIPSG